MMYLTPSTYEMRSMGAQPFIQAQIHPASGTIQQGIMLPHQHLMAQERSPEEFYYQERMVPQSQGSMVHQERMLPFEHMVPQESLQQERLVPHGTIMPQEHLMLEPQETMVPQGRMLPQERMVPQENVQKIVHTDPTHPQSTQKQDEQHMMSVEPHNDLRSDEDQRAVKSGYEYSHQQAYPQAPSYGYGSANPSYNTPAPSASSYTPPAAPYTPPAAHSDPATKFLLKPDLTELIKPVTGKMAGKLSGLGGLALSLLGSGKGLELTGIKDLLIDGILKPLLVAKGGLKALISKLSIPVIALILINVEVLITVWWLWEDCPDVKHEVEYTKPSYPAGGAATHNYNYR